MSPKSKDILLQNLNTYHIQENDYLFIVSLMYSPNSPDYPLFHFFSLSQLRIEYTEFFEEFRTVVLECLTFYICLILHDSIHIEQFEKEYLVGKCFKFIVSHQEMHIVSLLNCW